MGAEPWFYFVDYQSDINQCLQELRQREFKAGRYNPAVNPNHAPRCKQAMIESNKYDVFEDIERGQGIYIVVYEEEKPTEVFFAGYSFD
jgi:hypothetical protein